MLRTEDLYIKRAKSVGLAASWDRAKPINFQVPYGQSR